MNRLLRSTLLPLALLACAIIVLLYSYFARPKHFTTGERGRPISSWSDTYYAVWSRPLVTDLEVQSVAGDLVLARGNPTILNSAGDETEPAFDPSGRILVFSGERRGGHGGYDLFWCRREGEGFSPPRPLPSPVNGIFHERSPSLADLGGGEYLLAFTSNRAFGGVLDHDIYISRGRFGGEWSNPRSLETLSTGADERHVAIFPGATALVFSRPGAGGTELYESWLLPGELWSEERRIEAIQPIDGDTSIQLTGPGTRLVFRDGN